MGDEGLGGFVALLAGCGSDPALGNTTTGGDTTRDAGTIDAPDDDPIIQPGDASSGDDCTEDNKKIYVLSWDQSAAEAHLLRFDPVALTYTNIGKLDCQLSTPYAPYPHSMAVDRRGTAWVSMASGALARVSTTTAACTDSGMELGQETVSSYGMGFATVGTSTVEKLYIAATGSAWTGQPSQPMAKLGVIDTATLKISIIGPLEAPVPSNSELSGSGDGNLFTMVVDVSNIKAPKVSVAKLDAATGASLETKPVPLEAKSGFAFAHWGGDLWLFTQAPDGKARVAQLEWATGTVKQTVDADLGVPGFILGAGVSTCAPLEPPK
ncbi:Hypothetical protein A7982_02259 [Minicystis rosea]|nr:Hypothetical protein A7982_02259 [Minicystis rosea]